MNSNKAKVSGSVVTGPVNPGVQKRKAEETEGGGDGKRLAGENGGPTGKDNLAKEVARLREENRKLKEVQEQQQRLLETMQLQIQELRCQVFGEDEELEVETGDEATNSDHQGNGENLSFEMATEPVPLGPAVQVLRNPVFDEAKAKAAEVAAIISMIASGSQRNRNSMAVQMVTRPVSSKSEVLIPARMKTVDKLGLCYYVLQKGTDYNCILKQIYKIDPSVMFESGFCSKLVAVKRRELSWGPERLLRDLILPFCRGNPGVHGIFNELDRRNVWLHGPIGMGKETWLRNEFPPEQGYLYIYSRQDLKQFKPREHKGIVAINLKMCPVLWPAEDLRQLVGFDLDRTFYFGRKKIEIPQWTQRIVTSEQAPSEMFGVYEKYLKRNMSGTGYFKGMMWRTIAVHVTRPISSLIS